MRFVILLIGMLVVRWVPGAVRAQDVAPEPDGYRDAIDQAVEELAAHHYEEARALFVQAHALYPNARTHRGLGFAEFELRNYVQCVHELEAALASGTKPLTGSLREDTERLLDRAKKFVARLSVQSRPAATEVVVDDVRAPAEGELMLAAGEHTVEVQTPGYALEKRVVHLRAGETRTLSVVLRRLEVAEGGEREPSRPLRRNPWLWTSVGLAVVGAAVAGTVFALRRDSESTVGAFGGSSGYVLRGPPVESAR